MTRRRIHWPEGNSAFDAWEVRGAAGTFVVRRNHALVGTRGGGCQGWDIWRDGTFVGAVGTCSLADLTTLPVQDLLAAARPACCGRHTDVGAQAARVRREGWGGQRPNAGRPPRGPVKRVMFATTIAPATLERIDRLRGTASRGEYLDHLVASAVGRSMD